MIVEDSGDVALDQVDGGFDVAGLDRPPDLADEEAGAIGRRRRGG